jgi:hypothetical protein
MILGVAVGRQHALDSARALFTLPGSEPISAHLAILSGPVLTLPAVLPALLSRRGAGLLLLGGSLISLTSVIIGARQDSEALAVLWPYVDAVTLPMALLGVGFFWLGQLGPIFRLRRLEDEPLDHSKSGEFRLPLVLLLVVGVYAGCARFPGGWQAITLLGRDAGMAARLAIACGQLLLLPALACALLQSQTRRLRSGGRGNRRHDVVGNERARPGNMA